MPQSNRVYHIDALRAYAILMMLQGHFIYSLLAPGYRDEENFWYTTWMFCKGFTAPIFFTVTGLILVFLLFRKRDIDYQNQRLRKTFRRGFYLILWGYLLRLNVFGLFNGQIFASFWLIDVLHCIGIALLLIALIFLLFKKYPAAFFGSVLLFLGVFIFLFQPWYSGLSVEFLPTALANYISQVNGSVFTPLPWVGYAFVGAAIGILYHYQVQNKWNPLSTLVIPFLLMGLFITFFSSKWLMNFHHLTGIELFKSVAYNNFLFIRLGHILIFIAGFILLEKLFAKANWFGRIGQRTLNIYIIHFILLYGSWFGLGFARYWANQLSPVAAISGAIFFLVGVTLLAFLWDFFWPKVRRKFSLVFNQWFSQRVTSL